MELALTQQEADKLILLLKTFFERSFYQFKRWRQS